MREYKEIKKNMLTFGLSSGGDFACFDETSTFFSFFLIAASSVEEDVMGRATGIRQTSVNIKHKREIQL